MKLIQAILLILLLLACHARAQHFSTLYEFNGGNSGEFPSGPLLQGPGGILYGETDAGGASDTGTLFSINSDASGFSILCTFLVDTNSFYTNSTGWDPEGGLILSGDILYGTAYFGGVYPPGWGAIFSFNTETKNLTGLYSFNNKTPDDGVSPEGSLLLINNMLYGTAPGYGLGDEGSVFSISTVDDTFSALHSFSTIPSDGTNDDGAQPSGPLLLSGSTLYGTAYNGGLYGAGALFAIGTGGIGFTNFYSFSACINSGGLYIGENQDGAGPIAGLIISGTTLYGTTTGGGTNAVGTVFSVSIDGTGFKVLHHFTAGSDGGRSYSTLLLSGSTLYGTAAYGNTNGFGAVFSVNTDGSNFRTLHDFTGGDDGANPTSGLILASNTLYGVAEQGGTNGYGTVFSISVAPQLAIRNLGNHVILSWPDVATGYTLKSTTSLVLPVTWTTVTPAPVITGGQFTVTNIVSGKQIFYQLSP